MPGLGRHPHFDERSRSFPARGVMPTLVVRKKTIWAVPAGFPLNQGSEGACVGFGCSGELAADPVVIPNVTNAFAFDLYQRAREQDRLMGNVFDDGASVLAGVKACKAAGHVSTYRWAFGIDDVIDTLCSVGPVVIGIPWLSGMYDTDPGGLVDVSGEVVGGHCILLTGYWPDHPQFGDVVVWENSWGASYGVNGRAYVRVTDLAALLSNEGEACVLTDRVAAPPTPKPSPVSFWQWLLSRLGW